MSRVRLYGPAVASDPIDWRTANGGPREGSAYMLAVRHYVEQRAARLWRRKLAERLGDGFTVEVEPFVPQREDREGQVGLITVESRTLLTTDADELVRALDETCRAAQHEMDEIMAQEVPLLEELVRAVRRGPTAPDRSAAL